MIIERTLRDGRDENGTRASSFCITSDALRGRDRNNAVADNHQHKRARNRVASLDEGLAVLRSNRLGQRCERQSRSRRRAGLLRDLSRLSYLGLVYRSDGRGRVTEKLTAVCQLLLP